MCLYSNETTDLVVDVGGSFAPESVVLPLAARTSVGDASRARFGHGRRRLQWRRSGSPGRHGATQGHRPWRCTRERWNRCLERDGDGSCRLRFVTVYPCGEAQPLASSLNYVGGQTVPNAGACQGRRWRPRLSLRLGGNAPGGRCRRLLPSAGLITPPSSTSGEQAPSTDGACSPAKHPTLTTAGGLRPLWSAKIALSLA